MTPLRPYAFALLLLAGCGVPPAIDPTPDAGPGPEEIPVVDAGFVPCEPVPPGCQEESTAYLRFGTLLAPGLVTSYQEGYDWVSEVDASRSGGGHGGMPGAPRYSYVYARFDPAAGLVKLDLTDAQALLSSDWDIAFRRAVIRINGGDSGPSCVTGSRASPAFAYEYVWSPTQALAWRADDYMTAACSLIPDETGFGSPSTVLASYYSPGACSEMNGNVYLLTLRSGRHVKLTVTSVYTLEDQRSCDNGQAVAYNASGFPHLRWSFLD